MNQRVFKRGAIALAVAGAVAGIGLQADPSFWQARAESVVRPAATAPMAVAGATGVDFSAIVEQNGAAVVNISVTGKAERSDASQGLSPNDPYFEFFKRFGPQFQMPPEGARIMRGQGSGFIISPDGLILTNAHVVSNADRVTVKLTDRREFSAKVLGTDPQSDVAVLRIDAKNLPVVRVGDPSKVKVGEPVLAIGSPFGLENPATAGIVSAKARSLPSDSSFVPFIQTDVAVNPGNSGGPLFNSRGEVIGINSQIYSRTGGYQGLSFAIPIDVAFKVQQQLVATGKVTRGRLGVTIQEVNQSLADAFGLKRPMGALVSAVEAGSPAERAGLEPGDVIVRAGDVEVDRSSDLPARITEMKPGTAVKLEVIRKGAAKTLTATVGEQRPPQQAKEDSSSPASNRLGLAVRPLDRDEKKEAGLGNGLVIEQASGPAARAGLQPGDVIVACNGTPVTSVEQLRKLLGQAKSNVALLIQRDDAKIFVPVEVG